MLLNIYQKYLGKFWFRAVVPGFLAAVVFSEKFVYDWVRASAASATPPAPTPSPLWYIVTGAIAAIFIPIHSNLISKASEAKQKEVEYYMIDLKQHQWLFGVIKGMLLKKMDRFRKPERPSADEEYKEAVLANLEALREFFNSYAYDPKNNFRITYFKPSDDGQFLISELYANSDGTPPVSHGDVAAQMKSFHRDTSLTVVVKAWKDRQILIAENASEIDYLYSHQRDKYKSIIAFPVFENNDAVKHVIAVISITSSKEFFKRQYMEQYKNYIEQFALRLVFEYCKLQSKAASGSS